MANYNVSGLVTLSELAKENNQSWWVYIVVCADHSFYTGITNDIHKRLSVHNSGKGAKYTQSRLPVKLVYQECYPSRVKAGQREYQIKQLSRYDKEKLIHS